MNHWQMIALAYTLTFVAIALEVALLSRRRGNALRQARAWLDAEEAPAATVAGGGSGVRAGAGAAS